MDKKGWMKKAPFRKQETEEGAETAEQAVQEEAAGSAESTESRQAGRRRAVSSEDQETESVIEARVLSLRDGLRRFEDVTLVRIVSSDYNLLILKDYMPIIGKVEGSVQIVGETDQVDYDQIRGFYMFRQNYFELLIDEDTYVK